MLSAAGILLFQTVGAAPAAGSMPQQKNQEDGDVIDASRKGSLTVYKYDMTAAGADGVDLSEFPGADGEPDEQVEREMEEYAVAGAEFSCLYCGRAETFSSREDAEHQIELVYEVPKDLAALLEMNPEDAYDMESSAAPCDRSDVYHYSTAQIGDALKEYLETGGSGAGEKEDGNKLAKDALEDYLKESDETKTLPLTDENGRTGAKELPLGLYLLAETRVPEYVTETVNPWFVTLPFTDGDGEQWFYDMTCYPKNQTGNPTLDKLVREAGEYTDKSGENTGAFAETTTMSEGDVLDYILVSRMPHIQSQATYLTQYSFRDVLSEGLEYNRDAGIAFYTTEEAAKSNDLSKAAEIWGDSQETAAFYEQKYQTLKTSDGTENGLTQMDIVMTDAGLEKINRERSDYWMVVFYTVTVNADATVVLGDAGNPNEAELTWRRTSDSYYDTLEDSCEVFTYGLRLDKLFSDGKGDPGKAEFVLYNATDDYYLLAEHTGTIDDRKVYYITGKTAQKEEAARFTPASDGRFLICGLEADDYVLTETATDAGYQLLKDPVEISIHGTEGMGETKIPASAAVNGVEADLDEFLLTDETYIVNDTDFGSSVVQTVQQKGEIRSAGSQVVLEVTNHRKFLLPQTGGAGSYLITIAGLGLAAVGVFAGEKSLAKRKKQGQEK